LVGAVIAIQTWGNHRHPSHMDKRVHTHGDRRIHTHGNRRIQKHTEMFIDILTGYLMSREFLMVAASSPHMISFSSIVSDIAYHMFRCRSLDTHRHKNRQQVNKMDEMNTIAMRQEVASVSETDYGL
jgi:hypothetical protein